MPDTLTHSEITDAERELLEASRDRHIAKRMSDAAYNRFQAALAAFRAEVDAEEGF